MLLLRFFQFHLLYIMKTDALFRVFVAGGCFLIGACGSVQSLVDDDGPEVMDIRVSGARERYSISGSTGVEGLVNLAVEKSPVVKAARMKEARMRAMVAQARSLPDPMAKVSGGQLAETAAGRVIGTVGVEQKIPFAGKRRAKAGAASKRADAAKAEVEGKKLVVSERVRMAYWDYYYATEQVRIHRENRAVLKTIDEVVTARVEANAGAQADLLRLSTEVGKVDRDLILARQQIGTAKARLNALLNRSAGSSLPTPRRSGMMAGGSLDGLIASAERNHPEVRGATAKLNAYRNQLRAAQLDKFPDFSVGVQHGFVSDSGLSGVANGRDQTMLTLGVTIPLWQEPRKARVREAESGVAEMKYEVAGTRAELRARIEDAWFRAKAARETLKLFDDRILPESKQAYELSLDSYSAGKMSFVDVLDTWRQLLGYELQQEMNRAALGKAVASLKSAAAIR